MLTHVRCCSVYIQSQDANLLFGGESVNRKEIIKSTRLFHCMLHAPEGLKNSLLFFFSSLPRPPDPGNLRLSLTFDYRNPSLGHCRHSLCVCGGGGAAQKPNISSHFIVLFYGMQTSCAGERGHKVWQQVDTSPCVSLCSTGLPTYPKGSRTAPVSVHSSAKEPHLHLAIVCHRLVNTCTRMHTHTYIYVHVRDDTYARIHKHTNTCIYTQTHAHIHICTHTCTYIRTYMLA